MEIIAIATLITAAAGFLFQIGKLLKKTHFKSKCSMGDQAESGRATDDIALADRIADKVRTNIIQSDDIDLPK